jgi:hypothetical protein
MGGPVNQALSRGPHPKNDVSRCSCSNSTRPIGEYLRASGADKSLILRETRVHAFLRGTSKGTRLQDGAGMLRAKWSAGRTRTVGPLPLSARDAVGPASR